MAVILYPRAAPPNCLRVWLGVFQATQVLNVQWELDGVVVEPQPLRPIGSVRSDDMLPANKQPNEVARAFTGVYEFGGLQPATRYTVTVQVDGTKQTLQARTLPLALPQGLDGWFNVLLVSCFHQPEDRSGRAGQLVAQLRAGAKPHLTFLMGDQVYLDLPTLRVFPDDVAWMADKFEKDYTANWWGPPGYGQILAAAPTVSIPDDHEYWNNFPNPTIVAENTWTEDGQARWRQAAEAMYQGFQLPYPLNLGDPFILDVPPVSFFLADMRHQRLPGTKQTMTPEALDSLDTWVTRVIDQKWFGVFVSGQSLFAEPVRNLVGRIGDFQLSNYEDFPQIIRSLARLVEAGRPFVCLTGDVHWGRITEVRDTRTGRTAIREVISSPASLVSVVGADQVRRIWASISEQFGRPNPWPRHPRPESPPPFFAQAVAEKRFACREPLSHTQFGNHVAMLGFCQMGGGVDMRVLYHEIPVAGMMPEPKILGPFELRAY
jgi:hypothetical protein